MLGIGPWRDNDARHHGLWWLHTGLFILTYMSQSAGCRGGK